MEIINKIEKEVKTIEIIVEIINLLIRKLKEDLIGLLLKKENLQIILKILLVENSVEINKMADLEIDKMVDLEIRIKAESRIIDLVKSVE
jgi:hypothetical protein